MYPWAKREYTDPSAKTPAELDAKDGDCFRFHNVVAIQAAGKATSVWDYPPSV